MIIKPNGDNKQDDETLDTESPEQTQEINEPIADNKGSVTAGENVAQSVAPNVSDNVPQPELPKEQPMIQISHCQRIAAASVLLTTALQDALPGTPNQWRTLCCRVHANGSTIERMYTGSTMSLHNIRAIPGVTRVTMNLPAGVLPKMGSATPDMPSLMNALDFFRFPERHPHADHMGPITSIQIRPINNGNCNIGSDIAFKSLTLVPLKSQPAAPLKRNAMNLGFQSYRLMQLEMDDIQSEPPGRVVLNADISPAYMLSTHQQLRLQAAVLDENVPLTDALLSIIEDLYEAQEKPLDAGLQLLPPPIKMPYGTMKFDETVCKSETKTDAKSECKTDDKTDAKWDSKSESKSQSEVEHKSDTKSESKSVRVLMPTPLQQPLTKGQVKMWGKDRRQKRFTRTQQHRYGIYADVNNEIIMALDANGNYHPEKLSDWCKKRTMQQSPFKKLNTRSKRET